MDFDYEQHVFKSPDFQSIVGEAVEFFSKTPLARLNQASCSKPIYTGKAVPPGSRTARPLHLSSSDLYGRLREHTESIQFATNLKTSDFRCRFMILNGVEQDLIAPVESELIRR